MAYATEQLNFNSMQSAVVKSIFEESEVLYSTWQKKQATLELFQANLLTWQLVRKKLNKHNKSRHALINQKIL